MCEGCPISYILYDKESGNCTTVHKRATDDKYFYKKRTGRKYVEEYVDSKNIYVLFRCYRRHNFHNNFLNLICRIKTLDGHWQKYSLVINHWDDKENRKEESFKLPCHGNSKSELATSKPFLRTEKQVTEKIKACLADGKKPHEVYTTLIKSSGGPYNISSQSEEPRNLKQVLF